MEFPRAAGGEGIAHGHAGDEVGGVVSRGGEAGEEVGGAEGADAGVEFPVAGAEFDFIALLVGGGFGEGCDGGDGVEAGEVFCADEAGLVAAGVVGRGGAAFGEVVGAGEVAGADEAFVGGLGGDGDVVADSEGGGAGDACRAGVEGGPGFSEERGSRGRGFLPVCVVGDAEEVAGVGGGFVFEFVLVEGGQEVVAGGGDGDFVVACFDGVPGRVFEGEWGEGP